MIYYGDEIGMGDNIYLGDRNGVRTPMQWSADRNAGFSRANPQRLYLPVIIDPEHHYETVNVDAHQQNPASLLWWMKRLVLLRKNYQAFGRGSIEFLLPENRKVLVFVRRLGDEIILVVANLSRFVNYVELDLSAYKGMIPVELFGHTRFPSIGELPYFLTLGPHAFYWFKLEQTRVSEALAGVEGFEPPRLELEGRWESVLEGRPRTLLERTLPAYLLTCRWFGGKAQQIRSVKNVDVIPFPIESATTYLTTWAVEYIGGTPETYLLPLAFASGDRAFELRQAAPQAVIAQLKIKDEAGETEGILYDAVHEPAFLKSLLAAVARGRRYKDAGAELLAHPAKSFRQLAGTTTSPLEPLLIKRDQSNTSVAYGDRLMLKLFRRVTEGLNPDVEIGRFLTEQEFAHVPPLAGHLELRKGRGEPATVGILQGLVANEGDAWRYTLDSLGYYFEEVLTRKVEGGAANLPDQSPVELAQHEIPDLAKELVGTYLRSACLLGQRTGEMHVALASDSKDPAFAPEPFTALYRRSLYQSMRTLADQSLGLLQKRLKRLPEEVQAQAEEVLSLEAEILNRCRQLVERKIGGMRIRSHGDYHLGQVLYTGKDFVIIDFEGEPARSITERRLKRSPLRDVACMLRSFNYAVLTKLRGDGLRPEDAVQLKPWGRYWEFWISVSYLNGYFDATRQAGLLPKSRDEINLLMNILLLEKAIYELSYELDNRPDWVAVPIEGILELIKVKAVPGSQ